MDILKSKHIINSEYSIKEVLEILNELDGDNIVIVIDDNGFLEGSISDGDIRRGLMKGLTLTSPLSEYINSEVEYLDMNNFRLDKIRELKRKKLFIIPIINNGVVIDIINLKELKSFLPLDALVMAGGLGTRLKPLTNNLPKPLINVGGEPIINYSINLLLSYGIKNINISINYLGDKIEDHFENFSKAKIKFIRERKPLGTLGSASLIEEFFNEYVLVINSDILTNINLENFFNEFIMSGCDMGIAAVPYNVKIPYAIMNIQDSKVVGFKEKPEYKYVTNGGIYIFRSSALKNLQKNEPFNATDLMETLIKNKGSIFPYYMREFWLDIGKHEDLEMAQEIVHTIQF